MSTNYSHEELFDASDAAPQLESTGVNRVLDELIGEARQYRSSADYVRLMQFVATAATLEHRIRSGGQAAATCHTAHAEFEAESVANLVCKRLGIGTPSEQYLSG